MAKKEGGKPAGGKGDASPRGRLRSVANYDQDIARAQRLRALALSRERKAAQAAHDRRVAILGGELIRLCRLDDEAAQTIMANKLDNLAPGERKSFDGWTWRKDG